MDAGSAGHHHATSSETSAPDKTGRKGLADLMVSMGYAAIPAPVVTAQPRAKDARKEPSRGPTNTVGSGEERNQKGGYSVKLFANALSES
jgi:hypothetical protein